MPDFRFDIMATSNARRVVLRFSATSIYRQPQAATKFKRRCWKQLGWHRIPIHPIIIMTGKMPEEVLTDEHI